jgi:hypothetical protein
LLKARQPARRARPRRRRGCSRRAERAAGPATGATPRDGGRCAVRWRRVNFAPFSYAPSSVWAWLRAFTARNRETWRRAFPSAEVRPHAT